MKIKEVPIVIIAFIASLCMFSACNSKEALSLIHSADQLHLENPDSAWTILEKVDTSGLKTESAKAEYALTRSVILSRLHKLKEDDPYLQRASLYYEINGTDEQKMKALYCTAGIKLHWDNAYKYIAILSAARNYANRVNNNAYAAMCSHMIANYYATAYICDEAISNFNDALESYHAANITKYDAIIHTNLAQMYCLIENYEKCKEYLDLAIPENEANNDKSRLVTCYSLYSRIYMHKTNLNYGKALEYLHKADAIDKKSVSSSNYVVYSRIMTEQGKRDSSEFYIKMAYTAAKSKRDTFQIHNFLNQWYREMGQLDKAYPYLELVRQYKSNQVNDDKGKELIFAQRDFYNHLSSREQEAAHKATVRLRIITGSSLIALAALIYIGFYFKRKQKAESQKLKNALETIGKELEHKNLEFEEMRTKMRNIYKAQFQKLGDLVETSHWSGDGKIDTPLRKKVEEITAEISNPQAQKILEDRLNSDIDNIMSHIRADFPKQKEKDYLFIAYMIIGFDATLISLILDLSMSAVYSKKFRMKERIINTDTPHQEQYKMWIS